MIGQQQTPDPLQGKVTAIACFIDSEAKVSPKLIRDVFLRACESTERVLVLRYSLANKYLTKVLIIILQNFAWADHICLENSIKQLKHCLDYAIYT